jgi:uncharacterized membrane protein
MWKAFARYLNGVRRDREPESSPEIFERYLPYAVGFGFGAAWVKYFQRRRRLTAVPAWFQAVEAAGGADAAALAGIITVMSTGHGSAAGGAGGGASGGGASGAG